MNSIGILLPLPPSAIPGTAGLEGASWGQRETRPTPAPPAGVTPASAPPDSQVWFERLPLKRPKSITTRELKKYNQTILD